MATLLPAQTLHQEALDYLKTLHKPQSIKPFKAIFHFPAMNQDTTNSCWSFSTLSFVESEAHRLGLKPVKLAVMFPVYFAFIEKARRFVRTKGESRFGPGDLFTGVTDIIQKYGMVPQSVYRGQVRNSETYNHIELESRLKQLMNEVKTLRLWDEDLVVAKVRQILDEELGPPPLHFMYEGHSYTPRSFRDTFVALPWKDYLMVTSFLYAPAYQFTELKVPDNWAHQKKYFNVPLTVFYNSLKQAVRTGFSVAFDSDIVEPGRMGKQDVTFVPPFDIPSSHIDAYARELRFENGSTSDDHLMHIIGFHRFEGDDWFLVKDSWRTAWQGAQKGYYFFHGDYIKLKVLAYLVHKDGIPQITEHLP